MEAQESVAAFAQAYSLGKQESQAALFLLHEVHDDVVDSLRELVRPGGANVFKDCSSFKTLPGN